MNPGARNLTASDDALKEFVRAAVDEHERIISSRSGKILKDAPESAVTIVELPGWPPVCVKEFRWRGWGHASKGFFRWTQGVRAFRNGRLLIDSDFDTAFPVALMRERRFGFVRAEWVIMELIPGALELDRYILTRMSEKWPSEEQRGLARLFGRFIAKLHSAGIFHSDLKTCNILVAEGPLSHEACAVCAEPSSSNEGSSETLSRRGVRFLLLDYDDVRFCRGLSWKQRTKNLTQLFLSTPLAIGASQRLRFLSEYAFHSGIGPKDKKTLAKRVLEVAGDRDILYVGFNGDIRENWRRTSTDNSG